MNKWTIRKEIECGSTNSLVKELRSTRQLCDKTALVTEFQSAGRGQGKNVWNSNAGENLLMSIYKEFEMPVDKFFLLTIIVSIALHELLNELNIQSCIKWPNDIYVGEKKIAGILIENCLVSGVISNSIIGIGLNVNQTKFPEWILNPISLSMISGKTYNFDKLIEILLRKVEDCIDLVKENESMLFDKYNNLLFKKGIWTKYSVNGNIIKGQIHCVLSDGRLIMEMENGEIEEFLFGEISYIL